MHFARSKLAFLTAALLVTGVALADNNQPAPEGAARNAAALVSEAARYEHAEGVPRDYGRAISLYCAAAKANHPDGQYGLGWMYANGRGVDRDDAIAAYLFNLAAQQGHLQAQNMQKLAATAKPVMPPCLVPPPKVVQAPAPAELPAGREPNYPRGHIYNMVGKVSPKYEVDPQLVLAFIAVESGFNANAVSPRNAQGLMQLIPETARRFRVKDAFNAEDNIKGGVAYLQWLLAFFKGDVPLVAAAYNAGERAVEKYRGIPPYPETRDYVRRITALYRKTSHPYRQNLVPASPMVSRVVAAD
ncbi:transglycosylase SLT domain-containing protein [Noviherbaspirillum suwonense]|uniref:Sel1 repeat-containing protein n=1 Tax=Noviherbaspirillum suwonense TaxID=1224511 RepID=A0ABY1QFH6_9BURK|nr:transglycosylase SLT domain-containing protein [Noviherbaspirillum suwonense]SMP69434.1 Sel1 repeat-containing protein [Noviherbaspirillum suwonense]